MHVGTKLSEYPAKQDKASPIKQVLVEHKQNKNYFFATSGWYYFKILAYLFYQGL